MVLCLVLSGEDFHISMEAYIRLYALNDQLTDMTFQSAPLPLPPKATAAQSSASASA
jgi:hypothetical protein